MIKFIDSDQFSLTGRSQRPANRNMLIP